MTKFIATKIHKAIEFAPDCDELTTMAMKPLYCVDKALIDLLGRSDIQAAIGDMVDHELAKMPHQEIVVEFDCTLRHIIHLSEIDNGIKAATCTYTDTAMTVGEGLATLSTNGIKVEKHASEADGLAIGIAVAIALLMSNVRGIEKEHYTPDALNKARIKSNKPIVPKFTVVRIGTVYDRNGNAITGESAKRMPVHMRAGHARNQHYGEGFSQRKLIYIPPTLVNYTAGDTLPAIRRKVTI